jgi:hypothetical protein
VSGAIDPKTLSADVGGNIFQDVVRKQRIEIARQNTKGTL